MSKRVTLANGGGIELNIGSVRLDGDNVFALQGAVASIAPGKEVEVTIRFAPAMAMSYQATLIIESDASNDVMKSVPVNGAGVAGTTCGDCNNPPLPACLTDDDRVTYAETGTCLRGACQYTATVERCAEGCEVQIRACRGAAAPDAGAWDTGTSPADSGPSDAGLADATSADASPTDTGDGDSGVNSRQQIYPNPGTHNFRVPEGVTEILVRAWGGGGQGGNQAGATGGGGGFVQARVPVTPHESLDVWVAQGGGIGTGSTLGDGGGATYLRRGITDLLIAAGGGGGGSDGNSGDSIGDGRGGAGGGLQGENGHAGIGSVLNYCATVTGGNGATQAGGGAPGISLGVAAIRCDGQPGVRDIGGRASGTSRCEVEPGADHWESGGGQANGGGGGSSFADPSLLAVVHQAGSGQTAGRESESFGAGHGGARCQGVPSRCVGNKGGNGRVEISY